VGGKKSPLQVTAARLWQWPFLPAVVMATAGVLLDWWGRPGLGLIFLGVAVWSGLVVNHLRTQLAQAEKPRLLMEERLLQTQKLAALGEMAAGISHEINNPLAIIRQEAEWLEELLKVARFQDASQLGEFRDSLGEIIRQVERAREVTSKVLDLARERRAVIQKLDLNRLLEDMARLVEEEARKRQIIIKRNFAENLPPLESDGPLLRQALLNLLLNALQAIKTEGGEITLTTTWVDPDHVKIAVRDTGEGMAADIRAKIFLPFFTTKPPGQGTGLGLAITQTIIHKLGGTITVASAPQQGSTFTIMLPLLWEEQEELP